MRLAVRWRHRRYWSSFSGMNRTHPVIENEIGLIPRVSPPSGQLRDQNDHNKFMHPVPNCSQLFPTLSVSRCRFGCLLSQREEIPLSVSRCRFGCLLSQREEMPLSVSRLMPSWLYVITERGDPTLGE
jgi:hypothetical protein